MLKHQFVLLTNLFDLFIVIPSLLHRVEENQQPRWLLDDDALRVVANGVNKLRSKDNATIVVTHYQRLLDHIIPDFVHVLYQGRIVKSGTKELALELEEKGYDWIKEEVTAS